MTIRRELDDSENDSVINDDWILQKCIFITKNEYINLYKLGNYENYIKEFFTEGILSAFRRFYNKDWFKKKYLRNEVNTSDNIVLKQLNPYLLEPVTTDIYYYCKGNENQNNIDAEIENYKKLEGVTNVFTKQNGLNLRFCVDFYLQSNKNLDLPEQDTVKIVKIEENYKLPKSYLIKIFKMLSNLKNEETENVAALTKEQITFLLREKFNFCTLCCKQYGSRIEMVDFCTKHTFKGYSKRYLDILCDLSEFDFKNLDYNYSATILDQFIYKISNDEYECNDCKKMFNGLDAIKNHLEKRHGETWDLVNRRIDDFNLFITKIDLFILEWICQTDRNRYTPVWCNSTLKQNRIVYNLKDFYKNI